MTKRLDYDKWVELYDPQPTKSPYAGESGEIEFDQRPSFAAVMYDKYGYKNAAQSDQELLQRQIEARPHKIPSYFRR